MFIFDKMFNKIQRKHQKNKEMEKGMNENELCLDCEETYFCLHSKIHCIQKNPLFLMMNLKYS